VVNIQKEKNFSQYLHELRINYVLDEILSNPHYRKFTIKAIAEECGYSNGDSFSKAFRRKTGIYPSYYIKKLDKIENTNGGG
jgi:AraC-like DNA-binding protein